MQTSPAVALRIAVLLTNDDQSEFSARFPSDAEKVCTLLRKQEPQWSYDIYSAKDNQLPSKSDADGFVITGSPASVNDSLPWIEKLEAFIQDLNACRAPLVGLCFGHQLIAKALGGRVLANPGGWRFGVADTTLSVRAPWMHPTREGFLLHACHSEQVTELPREAVLLGGDALCHAGSFLIGRHIFTTQYHPEFSTTFMQALAEAYRGEVPDPILNAGIEQLEKPVDSDIFSRWVVNFFRSAAWSRAAPAQD